MAAETLKSVTGHKVSPRKRSRSMMCLNTLHRSPSRSIKLSLCNSLIRLLAEVTNKKLS
jgi:hypothetical protein